LKGKAGCREQVRRPAIFIVINSFRGLKLELTTILFTLCDIVLRGHSILVSQKMEFMRFFFCKYDIEKTIPLPEVFRFDTFFSSLKKSLKRIVVPDVLLLSQSEITRSI
jgi:hypothetical protein